jgi:hypothetical protein
VERKGEPRHYTRGTAATWWEYAGSLSEPVPVFVDLIKAGVPGVRLLDSVNADWHQIALDAESH